MHSNWIQALVYNILILGMVFMNKFICILMMSLFLLELPYEVSEETIE